MMVRRMKIEGLSADFSWKDSVIIMIDADSSMLMWRSKEAGARVEEAESRAEAEPGARGETAEIEEISADTTDQVGLTEDLSAEEGELLVLVRGTEGGLQAEARGAMFQIGGAERIDTARQS